MLAFTFNVVVAGDVGAVPLPGETCSQEPCGGVLTEADAVKGSAEPVLLMETF